MNRNELTPAPWTPHHHMKDCVTFIGKDGEENLFISNSDGYFACQSEQDANLISSAPELLAALENLLTKFKERVIQSSAWPEVDAATSAINKANGR